VRADVHGGFCDAAGQRCDVGIGPWCCGAVDAVDFGFLMAFCGTVGQRCGVGIGPRFSGAVDAVVFQCWGRFFDAVEAR
jgi:hypothetical protein